MCDNAIFDSGYNIWQFISADVWMSFVQNLLCGTELYKKIQNSINISPLIASCIQLAITVRTCTTFAKAIIAVGVNNPFLIKRGQVSSPRPYIFASFQNNWLN